MKISEIIKADSKAKVEESSNSLFGAGTIKRNTGDSLASLDASKMTSG